MKFYILTLFPEMVMQGLSTSMIGRAVDAGILGYQMYINGQQFKGGDGIISKGVENTIRNIGRLSKEGMKGTDKEIIQIMTDC